MLAPGRAETTAGLAPETPGAQVVLDIAFRLAGDDNATTRVRGGSLTVPVQEC